MTHHTSDIIPLETARTLAGLFRERVRRSPDAIAYRYFDESSKLWKDTTWAEMAAWVARWQHALLREGLQPGERVAMLLRNCCEWVMLEQAALGLGLVVVPLYPNDRVDNIAYIVQNAGVRLLVIEGKEHWRTLSEVPPAVKDQLQSLLRIVSLQPIADAHEPRLEAVMEWLPATGVELLARDAAPDALATIVYTSGTTGRPKGVMLSHNNILSNVAACTEGFPSYPDDLFLSFLPLCHTFERTVGYYSPMMGGATVVYARGIPVLAEDLLTLRPTAIVSVPRIFERVYGKIKAQLDTKSPLTQKLFNLAVEVGWSRFQYLQGRGPSRASHLLWPVLNKLVASKVMAKLGGRVRLAVCGGAPLSLPIAKVFLGFGLPLTLGYGLTETSPVISGNRLDDNDPASVGSPLSGIQVRIGDNDELLTKSASVMLGYWENPGATAKIIDAEGWLHTGDKARIENNHIYITGRLKDIIVMANGEKVPPADMELAIALDPLFEQVIVIGEGRPYLAVLVVLNAEQWSVLAGTLGLDVKLLQDKRACNAVLEKLSVQLRSFHAYAQVRRVALSLEPWTVENGLLTPTLKVRRNLVMERYSGLVDKLYEGH